MSGPTTQDRRAAEGDVRDQNPDAAAMRILGQEPGEALRMRHPPGLYLLFMTEMWERFSYYGMKAFLILYMTLSVSVGGLGWSKEKGASVYGWYTGLVYLTPIIGGYIADRMLGTARSMVIGGAIIAAGHFSLAFETLPSFYIGLICIVVGTGFFKPCVSVMVGQLYGERDPRRDAAFTIFYMGINLGAFLGPIICGGLRVGRRHGEVFGWSWAFAAAGVGMVLSLIMFLIGKPFLLKGIGDKPQPRELQKAAAPSQPLTAEEKRGIAVIFIMAFFVIFFWTAFEQAGSSMDLFAEERTNRTLSPEMAQSVWRWGTEAGYPMPDWLFMVIGAGLTTVWAVAAGKMRDYFDRAKVGPLVLKLLGLAVGPTMFLFGILKATGFLQEAFLPKDFLDKAEYPADWFQSVNPFFILTLAPVFAAAWLKLARKGKEPSTPVKFAMGLILLGLGFLFMVEGGRLSNGSGAGEVVRVSGFWLSAAFCVHTMGELCLSPVGLSMVNKLAPAKFVSLLMGVWFLSNFVANKLAAMLAGMEDKIASKTVTVGGLVLHGQPLFYSVFVVVPIAGGILLLFLTPMLKSLIGDRA
jgi:POT family proton-dependent oligopeptide transporter